MDIVKKSMGYLIDQYMIRWIYFGDINKVNEEIIKIMYKYVKKGVDIEELKELKSCRNQLVPENIREMIYDGVKKLVISKNENIIIRYQVLNKYSLNLIEIMV